MPPLRRVAGLAAVLCALSYLPVVAQEHTHAEGETDHHHGLHFSHPIFTESISPDTKVRVDFSAEFENDAKEWEREFEGEYAFHRAFSVEIGMPYVTHSPDGDLSSRAFGNAEVTFKFANYAFEESGVLLGYGIGIGLPSGDGDVGIGSDHLWEFEPFLNGGYKRGAFEAVGWLRFGIPTNQAEGEGVETDFSYDASFLYTMHPRAQALLEFNGSTVASGEEAGVGSLFVSPGVKFAPLAGRPLFVGIGGTFPLADDEVDAGLRISLFWHF